MKVFKFGGGVLKSGKDAFKSAEILRLFEGQKIIVVISAFNKVTDKIERLLNYRFFENKFDNKIFMQLKEYHFNFIDEIFTGESAKYEIKNKVNILFENLYNNLNSKLSDNYHFEYDKIVSYGEKFSSLIIFCFLRNLNFKCKYEDAGNLIKTDSSFREAKVLWDISVKNIKDKCLSKDFDICVTQGFTASDLNGNNTTLGREGSDFSASVIAYAVDAEEVIFWKEVEGIYNADPSKTDDYVLLPKLSYKESLEQAFYGAKILHPKTLKPLQNKKIPVKVKSFENPENEGTVIRDISETGKDFYPENPIFITEENQILISVSTHDFSFISEENLGKIFGLLSKHHIKVNLMQASAISFSVCVTNDNFKIPDFVSELKKDFKTLYNDNLQLITVRHYDDESIKKMIAGKEIILRQLSRRTARFLVREK